MISRMCRVIWDSAYDPGGTRGNERGTGAGPSG